MNKSPLLLTEGSRKSFIGIDLAKGPDKTTMVIVRDGKIDYLNGIGKASIAQKELYEMRNPMRICNQLVLKALSEFGDLAKQSAVIAESGLSKRDTKMVIRCLRSKGYLTVGRGKDPLLKMTTAGEQAYDAIRNKRKVD